MAVAGGATRGAGVSQKIAAAARSDTVGQCWSSGIVNFAQECEEQNHGKMSQQFIFSLSAARIFCNLPQGENVAKLAQRTQDRDYRKAWLLGMMTLNKLRML